MFTTATLVLAEIGAAEKTDPRCRAACSDCLCRAGIPATISERGEAPNQCRLDWRYSTRPRLCGLFDLRGRPRVNLAMSVIYSSFPRKRESRDPWTQAVALDPRFSRG